MEKISHLILTFLLNVVWQVTVVAVVAACCARLVRHAPARNRHLLWVAALTLSVGLPVWSVCNFRENSSAPLLQLPIRRMETQVVAVAANEEIAAWKANLTQREQSGKPDAVLILALLIVCYALFLLYRVVHLWRAWRVTQEIRRSSETQPLPHSIHAVAEQCRVGLQIGKASILFSSKVSSPATIGTRNPVIVLPNNFLEISTEGMLMSALGHEMAHIRRHDFVFNLAYELLYLPISFHPAATLVKRQINQTREMACDEMVTKHLIEPTIYARSLVQIAKLVLPPSPRAYILGVFDANILEERVMRLLKMNRCADTRAGKLTLFIALCLLGVTGVVTSAFSFSPPTHNRSANTGASRNLVGTWRGSLPTTEITSDAGISPPPAPRLGISVNGGGEAAPETVEAEMLTLTLSMDGDRLTGTLVREAMFSSEHGAKTVRENEFTAGDVELDGNIVSFEFTEDVGDEIRFRAEMTLVSGNKGELALTGESEQDGVRMRMEKIN